MKEILPVLGRLTKVYVHLVHLAWDYLANGVVEAVHARDKPIQLLVEGDLVFGLIAQPPQYHVLVYVIKIIEVIVLVVARKQLTSVRVRQVGQLMLLLQYVLHSLLICLH